MAEEQKTDAPEQPEQPRQPEQPEEAAAPEQAEGAPSAEAPADSPEQLTALLEDARAKADEHWDKFLRAQAEIDNLRRRHAAELEKAHKFALDGFVRELLPVHDSLELGHAHAVDSAADVEKLREGTELTLRLLNDVMAKFGIEEVSPEGEPFNPELHQAMTLQPRGDVPPNTVVSVVQKGYLLNGRLVRPALVVVSSAG